MYVRTFRFLLFWTLSHFFVFATSWGNSESIHISFAGCRQFQVKGELPSSLGDQIVMASSLKVDERWIKDLESVFLQHNQNSAHTLDHILSSPAFFHYQAVPFNLSMINSSTQEASIHGSFELNFRASDFAFAKKNNFIWVRSKDFNFLVLITPGTDACDKISFKVQSAFTKDLPKFQKVLLAAPTQKIYKAKDMPKDLEPKNFKQVADSMRSYAQQNCSGTFISTDGYYLTALHCIGPVLEKMKKAKVLSWPLTTEDPGLNANFAARTIVPILPLDKNMKVSSTADPSMSAKLMGIEDGEPLIAAIGTSGFTIRPSIEHWSEYPESMRQFFILNDMDWVILKYDLKDKKVPCTRLANLNSNFGDPLWAMGFPAKDISQPSEFSNKNRELFVSLGHHRKDYTELAPHLGFIGEYIHDSEYFISHLATNQMLNNELSILSDHLATAGMSGGPLINEEGELTGVLFEASHRYKTAEYSSLYTNTMLRSIRSDVIQKEVIKQVGDVKSNAIFSCAL